MPIIAAVTTAVPPYQVSQAFAKEFAGELFAADLPHTDRYLTVFDHAEIDTRFLSAPLNWYETPHLLGEANDLFLDTATRLGEAVSRTCLAQAELVPHDINHVIFVSTTGLAAPSIDARLITLLGLDPHTRRTPIWGLGCAGGLGGLERAEEYVRAFPNHRVLLVTVELCTLTAQLNDHSKRNLVAFSLFGDGAAAVIVAGDEVGARGARILGTRSTLFPDSLNLMGWDVVDEGFRVVFGAGIPRVVSEQYRELAREFLGLHGLTLADVRHHIYHPGGAKVLQAYAEALDLPCEALEHSRRVLRDYGNMSSATIFFVLQRFLQTNSIKPDEYGLLCVFGPGFSAELVLIQG